ncbi:MAG: deoxyribodipyrimidine photo-lyase [Desulfobulbaceae bacterium]|nr:deoxyribodipyrimidine photo-lyase [Desulfobulbaceae bacterium]
MLSKFNIQDRVRLLNQGIEGLGDVIYWMSRDCRLQDNAALLFAQSIAIAKKRHLRIVFDAQFAGESPRQQGFLLQGLQELAVDCKEFNLSCEFLYGRNAIPLVEFTKLNKVCCVVTDFDPLKFHQSRKHDFCKSSTVPVYEVDAHNIVPLWFASSKLEFAAYTIRPKITKLLPIYLTEIPELLIHPYGTAEIASIENQSDGGNELKSGESQAKIKLSQFIESKLDAYDELRNDPSLNFQSGLSPYLHFGMISAQRVALEVRKIDVNPDSKAAFLEELIIRKELSDNFCYYNPNYYNFNGFHSWAQSTLNEHRHDPREYLYSLEQFENAETHDKYWNAAQREMMITGKMHGYMRMYWAKKILEWTRSPEEALDYAIILNDKYSLDGRDPNGYTGIAWSIGGVHDRAWSERPVFGKIRFMNDSGLKRKFDIEKYVENIKLLQNENNNIGNSVHSLFGGL